MEQKIDWKVLGEDKLALAKEIGSKNGDKLYKIVEIVPTLDLSYGGCFVGRWNDTSESWEMIKLRHTNNIYSSLFEVKKDLNRWPSAAWKVMNNGLAERINRILNFRDTPRSNAKHRVRVKKINIFGE